jgi:sialidase-1
VITRISILLSITSFFATFTAHAELQTTTIYTSGTEGYHTFRIPAIIGTPNYVLAFAEGRLGGQGDSGDIDLVVKRSDDSGTTWSGLSVVLHEKGFTCGNPTPVWDRDTKELILLLTKNQADSHEGRILRGEDPHRTVWVTRSKDEGATWSTPEDISATTRKDDWRWYATGPCHGIQLRSGRLLIPANHSNSPDRKDWFSHVIYSDDHGKSWAIGGIHQEYTNESTVAELAGGRIYQNMRAYRKENRRRISYSSDGGLTWTDDITDDALIEPVCQASVLTFTPKDTEYLLFSNPASKGREKMTVRLSTDGGATWPTSVELYEGPSAYSDLVILPNGDIGCLYERGEKNPYESIVLARIDPKQLKQSIE